MKKRKLMISSLLAVAMVTGLLAGCGSSSSKSNNETSTSSANSDSVAEDTQEAENALEDVVEEDVAEEVVEEAAIDEDEKQTLKIGIATCFTGSGARGAETQLYGLQVALDEIEESGYSKYYDFDLVQGDDQYDATEAVSVANKLVYQDDVKAVFGHLNAVVTLAGLPVYEEAHVPCFTPSGSSEKIIDSGYDYVYLCVPQDRITMEVLMKYLVGDLGLTKLGILYCNNDQGQSELEYCVDALAEMGTEFADEETYLDSDTDFTGQLLNMKDKDVDCIVIAGGEVSQRSIMVQQARQLISTDIVISGDNNFSNATFISTTEPSDREGIIYPAAWSPSLTDERSQTYVEEFEAMDPEGSTPGAVTVRFYDGMYLLADALNELGPYDVDADDFTEKLNDAIKSVSSEGLQGTLTPAEDGECLDSCFIVRYNAEGEEEIVE